MVELLLMHGAEITDALSSATPKVLIFLLDQKIQNIKPSFLAKTFKNWPQVIATKVIPFNEYYGSTIQNIGDELFCDVYPAWSAFDLWNRSQPNIPELYKILLTHNWVRYYEKVNSIVRLKTVLLVHKKISYFCKTAQRSFVSHTFFSS